MSRNSLFATLALCFSSSRLLVGCHGLNEEPWQPPRADKDYGKPLPPGQLALRKIPPERYPDFRPAFEDRAGLEQAVRHSLDYLSRPSSRRYFPYGDVSHPRAVRSLQEFLAVLGEARSPDELDKLIRERFEVYQSVGCDDRGTVYFSGYYTPIFEGRKQADGRFRYPLHKFPPDLVKTDDGETLGRRNPDGSITPYYTRAEIDERQPLRGQELAWLKDPFEAYVVTVQGSAKLRLQDGSLWELGYSGNNGYEYNPIAMALIADGKIRRDELSLQTLMRYFSQHPEDIPVYTRQNPRYVFFKETSGGPYGSINVPVTPRRSLATDKQVFPRACLAYAVTPLPRQEGGQIRTQPYAGFLLDQDTGGAIRAAGRADVYFGVGPGAEALAGRTGAEGALYYIFVRDMPDMAATAGAPGADDR